MSGANASGVQGDVAQSADLDRLYETVSSVNRRIDIVFANAGTGEFVPFGAATEEHFDKLFINLEGHDLISVPLGFTDIANTTCLHVPSIGLIVAGDAAYNGVHLHRSESRDQQKRREWIAALDKMESLKPHAVIAGHKRVGNDDSPKILGEARG